ncbi:efflux transporter, RND family, MFP subunit [Isosphaera pallida ATCC 43644]|uniref:Efflux transporter, RND family, MFP subunit n=1 Tax=Isosphaera pallida (strain ATCC 43644 / DSM 9630 / IS1B) TaxID=575540 RepID=E8R003_ISOPI|nr:efflux RND transporter periplasmic adaptor subunit [Isosphaera pallida]ADV64279.1 efflux transporter, RND family, MFP subunit [Isosphaera pallida ATCC 43644]
MSQKLTRVLAISLVVLTGLVMAGGVVVASRADLRESAGLIGVDLTRSAIESIGPVSVRPLTVVVEPIELSEGYTINASFVGRVESARTSDLAFERMGRLERVEVREGDRVDAGQVLAVLDTRELDERIASAQARLDQARADLAELIAGPRVEAIATARAEVEQAEARLELARATTARIADLRKRQASTPREWDETIAAEKVRVAELAAAQARLDELIAGTRPERIASQRALVRQLEADLAALNVERDRSILRAPMSGTIAARLADEGTILAPQTPVVRLLETTRLRARIGVAESSADDLSVGESQNVVIRDRVVTARVEALRPDLDPRTRTVTVLLSLDDPTAADWVRCGDLATLNLSRTIVQPGFWLPAKTLSEGVRGLWTCLVAQPLGDAEQKADPTQLYRLARRELEILHVEVDRVFARGTLRPGDLVMVDGIHRVVPGQLVEVAFRKPNAPRASETPDDSDANAAAGSVTQ